MVPIDTTHEKNKMQNIPLMSENSCREKENIATTG
jgi:hypothetical protein